MSNEIDLDSCFYAVELLEIYESKNLNFKSNDEYVDFASGSKYPSVNNKFEMFLNREDRFKKSNLMAENYRKRGNLLYRENCWFGAEKSYTMAIAVAETGSVELALCYGNRSAVLFKKGYFKECLEDIQRSLENNYPKDKLEKLLLRQKEATELLPTQRVRKYHDDIPVIVERNENIPSASNSIKIRENRQYGRFIVAKKQIKAGEVILVEKPYCQDLNDENRLTHCNYCLELCYNMIPCNNCKNLYCSDECRTKDFIDNHKYLCHILQHYDFDDTIKYVAVKATLKGIKELDKNDSDPKIYQSNRYEEIAKFKIYKHVSERKKILLGAFGAAKVFHLLKTRTTFLSDYNLTDKEKLVKCQLFHDLLMDSNVFVHEYNAHLEKQEGFARAYYSVLNLFSHSCIENVVYHFYGNTVVLRALKDIKKGEQCFINYLEFSQFFTIKYSPIIRMQQHDALMATFGFECSDSSAEIPYNTRMCAVLEELTNLKAEAYSLLMPLSNVQESDKQTLLRKSLDLMNQLHSNKNAHNIYRVIFTCLYYKGNKFITF